MSYTEANVYAANTAVDKYRSGQVGEIGAALVVVGLSAERVEKEAAIRDDMIRVTHRSALRFADSPKCQALVAKR